MPTTADIVKQVDYTPQRQNEPRRVLVQKCINGRVRVLYDMPWKDDYYAAL